MYVKGTYKRHPFTIKQDLPTLWEVSNLLRISSIHTIWIYKCAISLGPLRQLGNSMSCSVQQCDAACCNVLQCVATCYGVLHCVAVCCRQPCPLVASSSECVWLSQTCLWLWLLLPLNVCDSLSSCLSLWSLALSLCLSLSVSRLGFSLVQRGFWNWCEFSCSERGKK